MRESESLPANRIEIWGGVECTVNRAGNRYFDQLELSGHGSRASDIERIASLGVRTVRYPFLWERIAPRSTREADWRWADERMMRLETAGITPIAGLLHHGSGPRHTNLLDPDFSEKFAEYAAAVAERYAGLRFVTPINEPLTTARFSALYGHWYPHRRSWRDFVAAILNQCVATCTAMRAMREHNSAIQLVQTEDLGRIYSTPRLEYQAAFENERRWLTFDLLSGRVDESHSMWPHLALDARAREQLESLVDQPCPPDVIGINYYVTSDRFLDERANLYPDNRAGGNGRDRYTDIEAVRGLNEGITGHAAIVSEAWSRYGIPIAITEAHMGCTREHQLRWLAEAWEGAREARRAGCDVRAVTAWALFGSYGWDSLVTREPLTYEPGAFDVRSALPRETAIADLIRNLASASDYTHPVAHAPGWWRTDTRFTVKPYSSSTQRQFKTSSRPVRPILVTGARGTLGSAFVKIAGQRGIAARGMLRSELDVADPASVRRAIDELKPWAVINAAGFVRVDDAELERAECYDSNTVAVGILARECARMGIALATFSSDLVFDGSNSTPYVESDRVAPLSAYGASKAAAEHTAMRLNPDALVIRTSAFFGPWDEWNFPIIALRNLAMEIPFVADCECVVSPTYVPDLVNASLDLLIDGAAGVWHLANPGEITWHDLAVEVAARAGLSSTIVKPTPAADMRYSARRPRYSPLTSEKSSLLPSLDNALDRWCDEIRVRDFTSSPALQL